MKYNIMLCLVCSHETSGVNSNIQNEEMKNKKIENMEFTVRIIRRLSFFKTFIKEESNIKNINDFIYKYIDKDCKPLIPFDFTKLKIGEERGLLFLFPRPQTNIQAGNPKYRTYVDIIRIK